MKTKLLGMYVGPPTQSMGYGPRQLSMVVPQSQYKNYGNMERGIEQISRNPFLLTPSSWAMKISQSQKKLLLPLLFLPLLFFFLSNLTVP
jgi:hypothetical protein